MILAVGWVQFFQGSGMILAATALPSVRLSDSSAFLSVPSEVWLEVYTVYFTGKQGVLLEWLNDTLSFWQYLKISGKWQYPYISCKQLGELSKMLNANDRGSCQKC